MPSCDSAMSTARLDVARSIPTVTMSPMPAAVAPPSAEESSSADSASRWQCASARSVIGEDHRQGLVEVLVEQLEGLGCLREGDPMADHPLRVHARQEVQRRLQLASQVPARLQAGARVEHARAHELEALGVELRREHERDLLRAVP